MERKILASNMHSTDQEIISSRELTAPLELIYEHFANPSLLKEWWGPEGFTNTIHTFDLRPEGKWILTMHGPEKGNYENSSIFKTVAPNELISWKRVSPPFFDMDVIFKKVDDSRSSITFRMIFSTKEECDKIRKFAAPKNEENFDRLERELLKYGM